MVIMGFEYLFDWDGVIFFFEDVNEVVYCVDCMMMQFCFVGVFDCIVGFVFGCCIDCDLGIFYGFFILEQVLCDYIELFGILVYLGVFIGYIFKQWIVFFGIEVEFDVDWGMIQMLELGVVQKFCIVEELGDFLQMLFLCNSSLEVDFIGFFWIELGIE